MLEQRKLVRFCCSEDASGVEVMVLKMFVSSGKVAIFELLIVLEKCYSYNRNNNGRSMEPCGTRDVTGNRFDVSRRMVVC